ncbi:hypothetical protein [Paraburkholderia caffeinilytica]
MLGFDEMTALTRAVNALHDDSDLRCLVITGGARAWIGGANIKEMVELA